MFTAYSHLLMPHSLRYFLLTLFLAASAKAHQVPNMTIEADFDSQGHFEMKVNVDPRVILSDQPTSLPPVVAAWYLEQTPEQVKTTFEKAVAYLSANLKLQFGSVVLPLPEVTWQAMDGTTNLPLTTETTEVHLLATIKSAVPIGQGTFALGFGQAAQVSLILLLKNPSLTEPKVMVLFPGETSRPFSVTTSK
jgi:hypothetical protein